MQADFNNKRNVRMSLRQTERHTDIRRDVCLSVKRMNCDNTKETSPDILLTSKRYEIGCQLVLITNTKSHTGFRLVPISVTLNDFERRNIPYFALFRRIHSG